VHQRDEFGFKCLKYACLNNQDLEVTKYLVEKCKLVPDQIDVECACFFGNTEIAIYLIVSVDKHELIFSLNRVNIDNWERLILGLKDSFEIFDQMLGLGLKEYDNNDFEGLLLAAKIIPSLNPLSLISRSELFTKYRLRDPMDPMFPMKDFIKHTNDLNFKIPIPIPTQSPSMRQGFVMG